MEKDPERLLAIIREANPWWERGTVPENLAPRYRRRDFFVLRSRLDERPITAIAGPRQVGKTTIAYQFVSALLSQGVPPQNILFVSFDLPAIDLYASSPLDDSIRLYEERVLQRPLRNLREPVYILLDEITKAERWHKDLKGWYDFRYNIRFLVTSSSSVELRNGAAESLAGRISTHLLLSWKFVDVYSLQTGDERLNDSYLEARTWIRDAVRSRNPVRLLKEIRRVRPATLSRRIPVRSALERYLLTDGFPELIQEDDLNRCARRLDEYIKLTLVHDLYRFYHVRASTKVFEDLLSLLAGQSGGLASYRAMAEALGIELRTLVEYLDYLEGAYMISQAQFYSKSRQSRLRKQRKIYIPNAGILNVLRGRVDRSVLANETDLGVVVESVVHGYAKRLAFNLSPGPSPPVYYWRDGSDREVDIVIEVDGKPLPIEVKYRANPKQRLEGLHRFISEKRPPLALVVTRDTLQVDDGVLYLPLEDFLMLA